MEYPNKISLDGIIDKGGSVTYIGDATYSHGDGFYKCLARVGEALCVVEVRLKFETNQSRVSAWVRSTFGDKVASDARERSLRAAEEIIELTQAAGIDAMTLHRLVDYVFSRPIGTVAQEIAGSLVTLYAAASALGVDADAEFEAELARIQRPEVIERCQRRQNEKRAALLTGDTVPHRDTPLNELHALLPKCAFRHDCKNIGVKWIARTHLHCDTHGSIFDQDAPWADFARRLGIAGKTPQHRAICARCGGQGKVGPDTWCPLCVGQGLRS